MRTVIYAVFFTLLCAFPAQAEHFSPELGVCMDKAGGVHPEMVACWQAEFEKQDKRLNAAYKKAVAGLSAERKKQLLHAQRAWNTFKETYSTFLNDTEGGQMAHLNSLSWLVQATAIRAVELEQAD